ncbi:MAG: lysoplasmalogenase [Spirochaetes bacterium]|nr:lysoplasmalogenase [Spirochaetota bacterium]
MPPFSPILAVSCLCLSVFFALLGEYVPRLRALRYVFKPLSTIILILWAVSFWERPVGRVSIALTLGLVFSLMGDALLLFESKFREGLIAFLLAHLAYLVALTSGVGFLASIWPFLIWFASGGILLRILWSGVPKGLGIPVALYMLALVAMAAQASTVALVRPTFASMMAAIGAGLFVVSDALLAFDRFRRPWRTARLLVYSSYFAAQGLLVYFLK